MTIAGSAFVTSAQATGQIVAAAGIVPSPRLAAREPSEHGALGPMQPRPGWDKFHPAKRRRLVETAANQRLVVATSRARGLRGPGQRLYERRTATRDPNQAHIVFATHLEVESNMTQDKKRQKLTQPLPSIATDRPRRAAADRGFSRSSTTSTASVNSLAPLAPIRKRKEASNDELGKKPEAEMIAPASSTNTPRQLAKRSKTLSVVAASASGSSKKIASDKTLSAPPTSRKRKGAPDAEADGSSDESETILGNGAFLKRLDEKHRPASSFEFSIAPRYDKAIATPLRTKPGPLSEQDYLDGYISDEGDSFGKELQRIKEARMKQPWKGEKQAKSRSGNEIEEGSLKKITYYKHEVQVRVDRTKNTKTGKISPHARIMVDGENLSTEALARYAMDIQNNSDKQRKDFVGGFTGPQKSLQDNLTNHSRIGIEYRAAIRGSDVYNTPIRGLEAIQMVGAKTPQEVSRRFVDPAHDTGQVANQNSKAQATAEFNFANKLTTKNRVKYDSRIGTDTTANANMRKSHAINESVAQATPIVNITRKS